MLRHRRCADLPIGISAAHVVRIGDYVYVGGGNRMGRDQTVYQYTISRDLWTPLPDCPTYHHSLATWNDELIALGGKISLNITNMVLTFRDNTWKRILPPMPTARSRLTTYTSPENKIIITVGGVIGARRNGERITTDVVEIYKRGKWYSTKRLPFPASGSSLCMINDTCYCQSGNAANSSQSRSTLHTTISSLCANATKNSGKSQQGTWETLRGKHPLSFPGLVNLDERLLVAMGGAYKLPPGTQYVSMYDFSRDTWVECKGAKLHVPVYRPGLVRLANDEVMLVGGEEGVQNFSKHVAILWKV